MPPPLLVFRVGYMPSYCGAGPISGGGSHVEEHGAGGEMWNFRAEGGRCFGYVMTQHFAGIDLRRLDPTVRWKPNDELDGVDIVFIAKKPLVGQVVVGWYKGATVFHKRYRNRPGKKRSGDGANLEYLCQVGSEGAILLPEDQRTFEVPFAPIDGKGFPGQSNVWYPSASNRKVAQLVSRLRKYISDTPTAGLTASAPKTRRSGRTVPDKDLIIQIEQAAVSATTAHFEAEGYEIVSVEKDNRGWDLEATKGNTRLLIEVKGHMGSVIQFELTPNEYAQLQANSANYRVCVVRSALEDTDVEVYVPSKANGAWGLRRHAGATFIQLSEKVAARAFEAEQEDSP